MAQRWKPLRAASYKEDFRPRRPILPSTYKTEPAGAKQHPTPPLPRSRANFTNVAKILWPEESYTKADVIAYYDASREPFCLIFTAARLAWSATPTGIAEDYFLQKDALPHHTPEWMLPYIHAVLSTRGSTKRAVHPCG
jgi:hypothetical protein